MDLAELCATLRLDPSTLRGAFRVGSRVYGTAKPGSDHDFLLISSRPGQRQDLLFGPQVNGILHGVESFQRALDDHSMMALEAFFAPPEHRLLEPRPAFRFALRPRLLIEAASERARSDLAKAKKCFDDEPGPSKKKVFHALRVALFADELLRTGRLTRFDQANLVAAGLAPLDDWPSIERRYQPELAALLSGLGRGKKR